MLTRSFIVPAFVGGLIGVPWLLSGTPEEAPERELTANVFDQRFTGTSQIPAILPGATIPGTRGGMRQATWAGNDNRGMAIAPVMNLSGEKTWIFPGDANGPDVSAGPLEFMPISNPGELFTFDIQPADILKRFDRITQVRDEQGRPGFRTELITGTETSDLHGCITWYFDNRGVAQRISFRGWAGDHRRFRDFLAENFLMTVDYETAGMESMSLSSWGRVSAAAVFRRPVVIRRELANQQVAILAEINRSSSQQVSEGFIAATQIRGD